MKRERRKLEPKEFNENFLQRKVKWAGE